MKLQAVRARSILTLAREEPAKGLAALTAPLATVHDGVILAQGGVILAVTTYKAFLRQPGLSSSVTPKDLGPVTLTPGLVNSHTHLELSHLKNKTLLGQGFTPWVASLIKLANNPSQEEERADALRKAAMRLVSYGTAHVGDISSRIPALVAAAARKNRLSLTLFLELFGHEPFGVSALMCQADEHESCALAGHALYSTSAEALVMAKKWSDARRTPFSMHLAEHADEEECLATGKGPLAELLRQRVLPPDWRAPGRRPVQEAQRLGLLGPGTLAVHCVRCNAEDIAALAQSGSAVALCPRSNAAINVGEAPAAALAQAGVLLSLGTDSLASNKDLNIWQEVRYLLQKNILPPNALLRMSTSNGAHTLGRFGQVGTLARGARFCYSVLPDDLNEFFP